MTDTLLTAASGKIREGDLVMVCYPVGEKTNNPAHSLDGEQFVVKDQAQAELPEGRRYISL